MKKRLIVLAMILSMAISQGGIAWGTGEGLENADLQVNSIFMENEKPALVNIIRPRGEIVTDKNLFISAQIFDGAKARLSVFRKVNPIDFPIRLNIIESGPVPYYSEELVYESPLIERREESVFYFEETTGTTVEAAAKVSSDTAMQGENPEPSTEELLMAEKLGEIFGETSSSGIQTFDEEAGRDVLFYYKKLENVKPGAYRIQFEVLDEYGDNGYFVEKRIKVKDFSFTIKDADEIKKEVLEILSKSFIGSMSR
ncbi:MAG: hypothetical protein JJE29_01940 [Peptostreptococcaceae bacterium]|nr:hypothetical protein [Peptostreptococcaceae bacterium]